MRITLISLFIFLGACSIGPTDTIQSYYDSLRPWVGRPATETFLRLGTPDSEGEVTGEKFYLWENSSLATDTLASGASNVYTKHCKIRAFVDKTEIVTRFTMIGNVIGCRVYDF